MHFTVFNNPIIVFEEVLSSSFFMGLSPEILA